MQSIIANLYKVPSLRDLHSSYDASYVVFHVPCYGHDHRLNIKASTSGVFLGTLYSTVHGLLLNLLVRVQSPIVGERQNSHYCVVCAHQRASEEAIINSAHTSSSIPPSPYHDVPASAKFRCDLLPCCQCKKRKLHSSRPSKMLSTMGSEKLTVNGAVAFDV